MSHFLQGGAVLVREQVCFIYEDKHRSVLNQDGIKVMDRQGRLSLPSRPCMFHCSIESVPAFAMPTEGVQA